MADEAAGTEGAEGTEGAGGSEAGASSKEKTFTQDEMNAIVQDRLARERKNQPSKDELSALRAAKAKLEEIEQAGATELEKAQKAKEAAEAKAAAALQTANERLVHAAVLAEAAVHNVKSPELLAGALDKSAMTVGDDGQVTGVEEAVKAAVAKYPELVGKGTSGSADQGARGGGPDQITREQLKGLSPREVQQKLAKGELNHLLNA